MSNVNYIKSCQEYDKAIKTKGIGLLNSKTKEVLFKTGFQSSTEAMLNSSLEHGKLHELNSHFNSIFYKIGFPQVISIKHPEYTEFIKLLDDEHIMYFIQDNASLNYPKIKLMLDQTF